MIDRRFPTALQMMHSLTLAQREEWGLLSSGQFAQGLGAHPMLVRKLLTTRVQHGPLHSQLGRGGGVRLARPAERITLRDVYEASVAGRKLWTLRPDLPHLCIVSTNFERYFGSLVGEAEQAMLDFLGRRTLAQSFDAMLALGTVPSRGEITPVPVVGSATGHRDLDRS